MLVHVLKYIVIIRRVIKKSSIFRVRHSLCVVFFRVINWPEKKKKRQKTIHSFVEI